MSKFKVGDRVRAIRDCGYHSWQVTGGTVGTVTDMDDRDPSITWDGWSKCWWYDPKNIEIAEERAPAIDAHYTKYAIQPMEFSLANGLDAAQHTVIKYTMRYRDKGGVRDLRAAIRVLELMIEREEKANG